MIIIDEVTNEYSQELQVLIPDIKKLFTLTLNYIEMQQMWVFSIKYQQFERTNMVLTYHPNILRKYRLILPFGLRCQTSHGLDPFLVDDFLPYDPIENTRAELFVLTADEVKETEKTFFTI